MERWFLGVPGDNKAGSRLYPRELFFSRRCRMANIILPLKSASLTTGPSWWDLLLSFSEGKEVSFVAGEMRVFLVRVTGMERSPMLLTNLILKGEINRDFDPQSSESIKDSIAQEKEKRGMGEKRRFECCFSLQDRKGMFHVFPPRRFAYLPKEEEVGSHLIIVKDDDWIQVGDDRRNYVYMTENPSTPEPRWANKLERG